MQSADQQPETLKIAVLGRLCVGKSSLLHHMTKWSFPEEYDRSYSETWQINVDIEGQKRLVELVDYSGVIEEHSSPMWHAYIKPAHCIVLVSAEKTPPSRYQYSYEPFECIEPALDALLEFLDTKAHIPICFWHNKIDVVDPSGRKVRTEEVYKELSDNFKEKCCAEINNKLIKCPDQLFLVSAKTREGVDTALQDAALKALQYATGRLSPETAGDTTTNNNDKKTSKTNRCQIS